MKASEKGIVLTMVLYIIVVFVIIGLVLVTLMTIVSQSSHQAMYSTQAYYLTESGLEYGLYLAALDPIWKYDNGALSFNGSDNYVSVSGTWGGASWTAATVEAWVNTNATTADFQAIVSSTAGDFIHLQLYSSGNMSVYTNVGAIALPIVAQTPTGSWRYIVLTTKSGESKVYVDNIQFGSTNTTAYANITQATALRIGSGYGSARWFKGIIDEVRIYNRALTPDEITYSYNYKVPMNRTGLVGWWKFTPGYTSIDSSGSGNNAAKYGATETTGVYKSTQSSLATGVVFNPPSQSNCSFSVSFEPIMNSNSAQNGTLISVGSVAATQVFSLDSAPAQRVLTMSVPRTY